MITAIVIGCYAIAWLFTARLLFGCWRGIDIENFLTMNDLSESQTAVLATAVALAWPLVWCIALVMFRPSPTAAERAAVEQQLKGRIAELEREAGIKP